MEDQFKHEDWKKGFIIREYEEGIGIDMAYPRNNKTKFVEVGLCDVRATDSIRVSFDFERSGWKIEQSYINEKDMGDYIDACTDEVWEEVGFYPNWNLEKKGKKINEK